MQDVRVSLELVGTRGAALGRTAVIGPRPLRLGRTADNDLALADDGVSRQHAVVEVNGERVLVRDLGSRNGTWVNGERLAQPRVLRPGDTLELGTSAFTVRLPALESPLLEPDLPAPDRAVATPTGRPVPFWWPLAVGLVGFLLLVLIVRSCLPTT